RGVRGGRGEGGANRVPPSVGINPPERREPAGALLVADPAGARVVGRRAGVQKWFQGKPVSQLTSSRKLSTTTQSTTFALVLDSSTVPPSSRSPGGLEDARANPGAMKRTQGPLPREGVPCVPFRRRSCPGGQLPFTFS